jgi:hypothetical protein
METQQSANIHGLSRYMYVNPSSLKNKMCISSHGQSPGDGGEGLGWSLNDPEVVGPNAQIQLRSQ